MISKPAFLDDLKTRSEKEQDCEQQLQRGCGDAQERERNDAAGSHGEGPGASASDARAGAQHNNGAADEWKEGVGQRVERAQGEEEKERDDGNKEREHNLLLQREREQGWLHHAFKSVLGPSGGGLEGGEVARTDVATAGAGEEGTGDAEPSLQGLGWSDLAVNALNARDSLFVRWEIVRQLEDARQEYFRGQGGALLEAAALAVEAGLLSECDRKLSLSSEHLDKAALQAREREYFRRRADVLARRVKKYRAGLATGVAMKQEAQEAMSSFQVLHARKQLERAHGIFSRELPEALAQHHLAEVEGLMDELGSMSVRGLEEAKKSASLARHALAAEQPALMEAEGHVHKSRYILGCLGLEVELQHLAPLVNKLRLLEHARRRAALACPRSLKYDDISLTHDPALPHTRDQAQTIEVTPTINGLDPHDQHLAPARPFVFRISPALPEGMRMDVATGEIAGWPTHCSSFTGRFSVLCASALGTIRSSFSLAVCLKNSLQQSVNSSLQAARSPPMNREEKYRMASHAVSA
jgi:hypothetical protein